ncbi:phage tail tube protein [Streptomyces sp. IBSBF 2435]|uniref:phage tail tube protein n=1 Tax=Streptomyces sp. IBSBF 2435 TaxID=2903531 RepID=UPI002FDC6D5E
MPRYGTTGNIAVRFAPTVVDMAAPTAAEVTAGVNLTNHMTRDGLKTPSTGNTIDAADAGSRFNATAPGTYGGDAAEYTGHRDSKTANDLAWTTLEAGTAGFLIVARAGFHQNATTGLGSPDGAPTAADRCEVYPVTVISRAPSDTGDNETAKFTAQMAITGEPVQDAVVAAGA